MEFLRNALHIVLLILCIISLILFVINLCLFILDLQVPSHAHLVRGLKNSAKNDYERAIKAYDKALKIKDDYASAYALRSEAYRALGKDIKSDDDWDKASQLRKSKKHNRFFNQTISVGLVPRNHPPPIVA